MNVSSLSCLAFLLSSQIVFANPFDPSPNWPLCGRISDTPPAGWNDALGCPADRQGANYTDFPFSSSFGPRQLVSGDYRYDFHRGIDIPTPTGTPVFAISDGIVKKAGHYTAYKDPLVQVRHYRPDTTSCRIGGCYVSNYMHLSNWVVSSGEKVKKGQLLGYTGVSHSGYAHLHFEIRNAPPEDPYSAWQRDAIHPLSVLPYQDTGANNFQLNIDSVNVANPRSPLVQVTLNIPNSEELDLQRIEVALFEKNEQGVFHRLPQGGEQSIGNTVEKDGYYVFPPWFDLEQWNRQYTHKNSRKINWGQFSLAGNYQCPYAHDHSEQYNANTHLDRQNPTNYQEGEFNGLTIKPKHFNASKDMYTLTLVFKQLTGTAIASNLCVKAKALDIRGNNTQWITWQCD